MDRDYLKQIADRVRIENDTRSPRLRLAVIGYLIEAGYLPSDDGFMDNVQAIIQYVCANAEEYADMVEKLPTNEDAQPGFSEEKDAYEILDMKPKKDSQGYL